MSSSVFANNRNCSHKGSGDKSLCTAPDVCKTPIGTGTPPIPYFVSSHASNLGKTAGSVKVDGNPVAIASSEHSQCMGDQAGTAKGLISSTTGDKTAFMSYSFDVKAEGEGIARHMDLTSMNNRNTVGMNLGTMTPPVMSDLSTDEVEDIYTLRFKLVDKFGQPIKGVNYKAVPAGDTDKLQVPDGSTNAQGQTMITSTQQDEEIDLHFTWAKVTVKKS
ncbi:DUF4150 domain-containing protein [Marinimicrobium alkaliphilum]|uniref:DUF4150 domain-containing protein n=1 Tax=Marinimicrobium alkaliphilum TaxID=2202654 RepID=UPI000DB9C260|nr:DUF4150 domain-containing protein [Marinimicrobium alkaliphilum]